MTTSSTTHKAAVRKQAGGTHTIQQAVGSSPGQFFACLQIWHCEEVMVLFRDCCSFFLGILLCSFGT